ncbi:response regulator [Tunicatimonas pelagia]|uniref:response regulator n=1 Tax=Tunicatimonas pelagia TaxID=931531 RepID=UPI00266562CF|nr:response regulator [Tunicatimonas pelagia]WKN44529.1 response regulator [Tunicatimonas pelagia]
MVLMIDDDNDTLEIYRLLVEKTPYVDQFVTENDPNKALQWLKEQASHPDSFPRYILLDLNMPDLNGIEFLRIFEKEINYRQLNTKIVVLTSSVREKDQREALERASVSEFISKPLSRKKLMDFLSAEP